MSTQIIRIESYNKGSLFCIGRECDRSFDINHRNSDIDKNLSKLNYSYNDCQYNFVTEFADIKASLNAHCRETKNNIAFEGMIITSDTAFFENMGWKRGEPTPLEVQEFFDKAYEWAIQQIGYQQTDRNIISAKIHYDEKTPHLHIYYVPITDKWQEKVYAKDENGHVIRSERGTPQQARDENGKIIYKQVENAQQPKLSKAEFWRVRGANCSYRMMQDSFQEKVGALYGLERGEVGSDRKHKTKYQHEFEEVQQLQQKKEKLEKQIQKLVEPKELGNYTLSKGLLGGVIVKGVGKSKGKEYQFLQRQYNMAKSYKKMEKERDTAISKVKVAEKREKQAILERDKAVEEVAQVKDDYRRKLTSERFEMLSHTDTDLLNQNNLLKRLCHVPKEINTYSKLRHYLEQDNPHRDKNKGL